jgi:hypothetical protein
MCIRPKIVTLLVGGLQTGGLFEGQSKGQGQGSSEVTMNEVTFPDIVFDFSEVNDKQARCILLNARSICNKIGELNFLIDQFNPSFILITESWLSVDFNDSMLVSDNKYNIVRNDRIGKRGGGGVCALIKSCFNFVPVQLTSIGGIEIVSFDVFLTSATYRFIVCYRPPYYDNNAFKYLTDLVKSLEVLCDVSYNVILVGDFNLCDISWSDWSSIGNHASFNNVLLNFACELGLSQCVTEPTRGDNIIDLIFTNDPLLISECSIGPPLIGSDHNTVHFNVALPAATVPFVNIDGDDDVLCYYNFSAGDYDGLNNYLSAVNWYELFANVVDINDCWVSFTAVLTQAIDLFVPVKLVDANLSRSEKKLLPLFIRQLYRKKMQLID